jgi:hypothetical protein
MKPNYQARVIINVKIMFRPVFEIVIGNSHAAHVPTTSQSSAQG